MCLFCFFFSCGGGGVFVCFLANPINQLCVWHQGPGGLGGACSTLTVSQSCKRENSSSIIPKGIVASWLERKATQRRIEARIFRSCSQPSNFVSTYLGAPKKEVFLPVRVDYW